MAPALWNHAGAKERQRRLKAVLQSAEKVASLHLTLTSRRGQFFPHRLLNLVTGTVAVGEVESLRRQVGVTEAEPHLQKFLEHRLIEVVATREQKGYRHTSSGQEAVNAVHELEERIGADRAEQIFRCCLDKNSIQLFLKVYGSRDGREGDTVIYTALEIGRIAVFLSRTMEGISSIEKLDATGLVTYLEDGTVCMNLREATAFYHYLSSLFGICRK